MLEPLAATWEARLCAQSVDTEKMDEVVKPLGAQRSRSPAGERTLGKRA